MPDKDDIYLKVMTRSFDYAIGQAEHQRTALLALYADSRLAANLQQQFRVKANVADDALSFETPLGEISVEFVPAKDGDYFCWAAVFRDTDEYGEPQDLYAARLRIERTWTDSTGAELAIDESRSGASIVTAFQCLQRALAAKLRVSEARLSKLES